MLAIILRKLGSKVFKPPSETQNTWAFKKVDLQVALLTREETLGELSSFFLPAVNAASIPWQQKYGNESCSEFIGLSCGFLLWAHDWQLILLRTWGGCSSSSRQGSEGVCLCTLRHPEGQDGGGGSWIIRVGMDCAYTWGGEQLTQH